MYLYNVHAAVLIANNELFKTDEFPNKQNLKRKIFIIAMTMEPRYVGRLFAFYVLKFIKK